MRIIIAGAGEVGTHLAKLLSQENQDITLMDMDENRLDFSNNVEILPVVGNPTSIADLKDAAVKGSDIFIAVTPEETTNLTACMIASSLGAHKTIARVSNIEYLIPENTEFFKDLGVGSLIYPEILASREIVSALKRPWSRQWWELSGGLLILIGVKVRNNAEIVDKYLKDLSKEDKIFHVVAIKRGNETIIPGGDDQIKSGDIVFYITTKEYIKDIQRLSGKEDINIRKITIMGGSRIALQLSRIIAKENVRVKILEKDKEKSYKLAEKADHNVMIIHGDGRDTDLLIQENIRDCDAFISLTESAETNILSCVAAKNLGVPKTVAQVENIDYIRLAEKLDIGTVINKKLIAASHIYQFLLNADVSNVKCLTFAEADVAELTARPNSKITRHPVKKLNLPKDMTLGGLIRDGVPQLINGDTIIQAYDQVVVFCLDTAMRKIEDYFN